MRLSVLLVGLLLSCSRDRPAQPPVSPEEPKRALMEDARPSAARPAKVKPPTAHGPWSLTLDQAVSGPTATVRLQANLRPWRLMVGSDTRELQPGEDAVVTVPASADRLAPWRVNGNPTLVEVKPGEALVVQDHEDIFSVDGGSYSVKSIIDDGRGVCAPAKHPPCSGKMRKYALDVRDCGVEDDGQTRYLCVHAARVRVIGPASRVSLDWYLEDPKQMVANLSPGEPGAWMPLPTWSGWPFFVAVDDGDMTAVIATVGGDWDLQRRDGGALSGIRSKESR